MHAGRTSGLPKLLRRFAACAIAVSLLTVLPSASQADPAEPAAKTTPAAEALVDAKATRDALYEAHFKALSDAPSDVERAKADAELQSARNELADRATRVALDSAPGAATGGLLLFVAEDLSETPAAAEAAQALVETYPQRAFNLAPSLAVQPRLWSEGFLQALQESSGLKPAQRPAAELCLAIHQRSLLFLHDAVRASDPEEVASLRQEFGEAFLARLQALDGDALAREATERFETLRAEHGESKVGGASIARHAEVSIRALGEHRLGMPAPVTAGRDLDGAPLSLADSRGKVVLLGFWASWCAPCVGEMPREKELLRRLDGQNFALLGVCLDEDLEAARRTVREAGATWPSFADADQSLAETWFAMELPSYAVVDRDGTIRARGVRLERAAQTVERLLREGDADRSNE